MPDKTNEVSDCCGAEFEEHLDSVYTHYLYICCKCGKRCSPIEPPSEKACPECKGTGFIESNQEDDFTVKSTCPICQGKASQEKPVEPEGYASSVPIEDVQKAINEPEGKGYELDEILRGFTGCCNLFVCCQDRKNPQESCKGKDCYEGSKKQIYNWFAEESKKICSGGYVRKGYLTKEQVKEEIQDFDRGVLEELRKWINELIGEVIEDEHR
jgi:hypothetical protein